VRCAADRRAPLHLHAREAAAGRAWPCGEYAAARRSTEITLNVITDWMLLAECDYFIGTLSSTYTRMPFLLMYERRPVGIRRVSPLRIAR
jgi:hypothetical protein